jgi:hypothetical protein
MASILDLRDTKLKEKDGIWYAENVSDISYPDEANRIYFDVEEKSFWFQHRNNCIVGLAKAFNLPNQFFDIGGGNGFVSWGMQQAGYDTYLLEPGPQGCLNAKKRGIKNVICSTLQESSLPQACIPACGLFDVVEHIEEDISFLKQVHFFMQPGAYLLLTVPAYNYLWSDEDDYIGHFRRYTLKTIQQALEQANFKVEYKTYLFSFLVAPILLFRSLPSWLHIKTKRGDPQTVKNDHSRKGFASSFLNSIMKWEQSRVMKRKKIFIGSSCLVVARKQ